MDDDLYIREIIYSMKTTTAHQVVKREWTYAAWETIQYLCILLKYMFSLDPSYEYEGNLTTETGQVNHYEYTDFWLL